MSNANNESAAIIEAARDALNLWEYLENRATSGEATASDRLKLDYLRTAFAGGIKSEILKAGAAIMALEK
jgi:hypothetical protein